MNKELLKRNFAKIGTKVHFREINPRFENSSTQLPITLNVIDEQFEITYDPKRPVDISVLDIDPKDRHLLLLAKTPVKNAIGTTVRENKFKLLCGHDERHFFSCGIPEKGVTRIVEAKKALMPDSIKEAHIKTGKQKTLLKRKNETYVRQGEWFFVRKPNFIPGNANWVKRNEPISRGRGSKPHICEQLYNVGGEEVYVHSTYAPNGINKGQFDQLRRKLIRQGMRGSRLQFEMRTKNADVYVRGRISHADHSSIHLDCWHQVLMNNENRSRSSKISVFLD